MAIVRVPHSLSAPLFLFSILTLVQLSSLLLIHYDISGFHDSSISTRRDVFHESVRTRYPNLPIERNEHDNIIQQNQTWPSTSRRSLRIAICISGMVRSFIKPAVFQSIKHNLIQALLSDHGQDYHYDIFLNLMTKDAPRKYGDDSTQATPEITQEDLEPALAHLGNVRTVRLYTQHLHGEAVASECKQLPSDMPGGFLQFIGTWEAFQLTRAYEIAHGFTYDWVIRMRADIGWFRPTYPLSTIPPTSVYVTSNHYMLSDHFALMPRHLAYSYFSLVTKPLFCSNVKQPPEEVLRLHLEAEHVTVRRLDLHFVVVRFHEGAECWRYGPNECYIRNVCESYFDHWTSPVVPGDFYPSMPPECKA
jgi:hypothetical protein